MNNEPFVLRQRVFYYFCFMSLEITGKVQQILQAETGVSRAGNEWKKQEFVIETVEQYPRKVCFTLFGDKTSLIENITTDDEVKVAFNLESREFNGKWYHNVNAWKIDKVSGDSGMPEPPPPFDPGDIPPEPADDMSDGLPF